MRDCFALEVCGIDYVIGKDGTPHFLEYNQFPGLAATPEIEEAARAFLGRKMDEVVRVALQRARTNLFRATNERSDDVRAGMLREAGRALDVAQKTIDAFGADCPEDQTTG